jgi:sugar lactone lactonase YvrE
MENKMNGICFSRARSVWLLAAGTVVTGVLASLAGSAQQPAPAVASLQSLQPEFDKLVSPNTPFEKLPIGFKPGHEMQVSFGKFDHFTEGPVWNPRGFLMFSDIYGDVIYQYSKEKGSDLFRTGTGYSNGLTFDEKGRLIICNQKARTIERLEPDGQITVLASEWNGKKLNCPNDVIVSKDGTIYFTDPYWDFPPGTKQDLDFQAVFSISPAGKLAIAANDFGLPNGIAFSPDQKLLYIGDTKRKKLYSFDVAADGSLMGRKEFADLASDEKGAVDGMKVDEHGDIFTTGPGGVWVFDKQGKHLGTIRAPFIPANCAWGGDDYHTLFLMTPKDVYSIHTNVHGYVTYNTSAKYAAHYPALHKGQ